MASSSAGPWWAFWRPAHLGSRVVNANAPEEAVLYVDNRISNTKYTPLTFLPKNLLEQFSRAMNVYFLLIACLQLIKEITPVNPLTTWLPLAVIFGVTAVKEGIDDVGRLRADNAANDRSYTVAREGAPVHVRSRDIRVGDLLLLRADDEVPCDCVLLTSNDPHGNAFIQTTNLDGESNLKLRTSPPGTRRLVPVDASLATCSAVAGGLRCAVTCPPPDEHIYKFDAALRVGAAGALVPLSSSQLLLQATHVRNTDWLIALVVYTGNETKFGHNKRKPSTKYTRTDGFINSVSAAIFAFQLVLVVVFGIIGDAWSVSSSGPGTAWYLGAAETTAVSKLVIPARFLLLNSTMIPISLKLTMDLCKLFYAKFIEADLALYDAATDAPARANSTALSEDLGQVRFVLTDKTGTLTENRMVLKAVSVRGIVYRSSGRGGGNNNGSGSGGGGAGGGGSGGSSSAGGWDRGGAAAAPWHDADAVTAAALPSSPTAAEILSHAASHGILASARLANALAADVDKVMAARAASSSSSLSSSSRQQQHDGGALTAGTLDFLRCLALNNDVVPSYTHAPIASSTNAAAAAAGSAPRVYKASSPDEEALVKAAAAYHVTLDARGGDDVTITLPSPAPPEVYTQLAVAEFTSDRKRMSVVLRSAATGRVRVYVKGADDVVLSRLADDEAEGGARAASTLSTRRQVDEFAALGLRTLVYAYRDLSSEEYASFEAAHAAAATAMSDREGALEAVYSDQLETQLRLLGASAIEDKLQDGVNATLSRLRTAGVSFWMLTGDKYSTALTIARTCGLLPVGTLLIEIEGEDRAAVAGSIQRAACSIAALGHALSYTRTDGGSVLSSGLGAALKATLNALTCGLCGHYFPARGSAASAAALRHSIGAAAAGPISGTSNASAASSASSVSVVPVPSSSSFAAPDLAYRHLSSNSDEPPVVAVTTRPGGGGGSGGGKPSSTAASRSGSIIGSAPTTTTVYGTGECASSSSAGAGAPLASAMTGGLRHSLHSLAAVVPAPQQQQQAALHPHALPGYVSATAAASSGGDGIECGCSSPAILAALQARAAATAAQYGKPPPPPPYCVIVTGGSLVSGLSPALADSLGAVCIGAQSVIACRVTPKQKAACVRLVKAAGNLTLSIGDGGNDVAMIQEAHVGVGIAGKEGLQAARAADYVVTRFRHLRRLLLVHGRFSYYRTSLVAQYSFYKSFLFCILQIGFGFYSGFAGVSLFNSLCVAAYNAVLFVPIVFFFVDRDVTQRTALAHPVAYRMCNEGTLMTPRTMMAWLVTGLWQAILILLLALNAGRYSKSADYESMGLLIFMAYMWVQDFTMLFSLRRATVYNTVSIFGMHVLAVCVAMAMNATTRALSFIDYYSFFNTLGDPVFWLGNAVITVAALGPVQVYAFGWAAYSTSFPAALYRLDTAAEKSSASSSSTSGPLGRVGAAGAAGRRLRLVSRGDDSTSTSRGRRGASEQRGGPPTGAATDAADAFENGSRDDNDGDHDGGEGGASPYSDFNDPDESPEEGLDRDEFAETMTSRRGAEYSQQAAGTYSNNNDSSSYSSSSGGGGGVQHGAYRGELGSPALLGSTGGGHGSGSGSGSSPVVMGVNPTYRSNKTTSAYPAAAAGNRQADELGNVPALRAASRPLLSAVELEDVLHTDRSLLHSTIVDPAAGVSRQQQQHPSSISSPDSPTHRSRSSLAAGSGSTKRAHAVKPPTTVIKNAVSTSSLAAAAAAPSATREDAAAAAAACSSSIEIIVSNPNSGVWPGGPGGRPTAAAAESNSSGDRRRPISSDPRGSMPSSSGFSAAGVGPVLTINSNERSPITSIVNPLSTASAASASSAASSAFGSGR